MKLILEWEADNKDKLSNEIGWGWDGGSTGKGYMYTYDRVMLLYGRNQHNIVNNYLPIRDTSHSWGFPGGSDGKESTCNAGDLTPIPGSGRSPGEGNGYPLQYSCLRNHMIRGAWWATVHGVTKSWTRLSN